LAQGTTSRPPVRVTADGSGVVSHAGSRLLADLARVTGLDAALGEVAGVGRRRRSVHDRGRVLVDLAVLLAEGGEAISDLAALREQPELFGGVSLCRCQAAARVGVGSRGAARERAWLARADLGR
jgi:hypothetical protein